MGIYSDGKVYGIHIKSLDIKITSSEPLTKQQIQDFFSEYNRFSENEKTETAVFFLESMSDTYINIPNKTYIWVAKTKEALIQLLETS